MLRLNPNSRAARAVDRAVTVLAFLILASATPGTGAATVDFARDLQPIFKEHCESCHGPTRQKHGFRVDRRAALLAGGDSGNAAVVPGEPDRSHLLALISGADSKRVMPPEGERLSAAQIALTRQWISEGATTPASYGPDREQVSLTHWSLRPVVRPMVPEVGSQRSEAGGQPAGTESGNPIDAFIHRQLVGNGLTFSPRADRRTLIRRLFLVMHGLPPTPEQVERFVRDSSRDAWPRLLNEVLASPHYGERWAGHWLDLARFGETHGFETNRERPNAWPYRDWVIDAFNADKPYDQFVREQIAGDSLGADLGTGFLVAGPYDLVKGRDPKLRLMQRMNELDDMINTTGTAFLGLTLGCARCHNHKFDPVTQTDYYSMQAIFAGVQHADRALPPSPARKAKLAALEAELSRLGDRLSRFVRKSSAALVVIDDADQSKVGGIEYLEQPAGKGRNPAGVEPGFANDPGTDKRSPNLSGGEYTWWKNQPGKDIAVYRPQVGGRHRIWLSWGAGHATHSTNAVYLLDEDGDPATTMDRQPLATVDQIRLADGTGGVVRKALWSGFLDAGVHDLTPASAIVLQGGRDGTAVTTDVLVLEAVGGDEPPRPRPAIRDAVSPKHNVEQFAPARVKYVRFTIEESSQSQPCLDELEVFSQGTNVALASVGAKAVSSGDFQHPLHQLAHINDGQHGNSKSWISAQPAGGWVQIELAQPAVIDRIEWARDREGKYQDRLAVRYRIEGALEPGQWRRLASSQDRLPFGKGAPARRTLYDFDSFPTVEAEQGRAWLERVEALTRERDEQRRSNLVYAGNFTQPGSTHRLYRGEPDQPREEVGPDAIAALARLSLKRDAPEKERRLAFANWVASRDNPLTARVIVNRLWQFHFGEGLVDTPSDLGANGTKPTHPELLDWLASELMDNGWSLKHIHRLLLRSRTWQQDGRPEAKGMRVDGGARLLWRFPPRRLEAEGIRDAMLAVAGTLDLKPGGPGFSAFEVELENVRHYHPKKAHGPDDWRRMIYMTKVRQEKDATFGTFDCPDASQVVPKRSRSTTPLQALNLLNSGFVMQQADWFAKRLAGEAGASIDRQVERAFGLCFGRPPAEAELADARAFIQAEGLRQFTRAMLNANEFVFVP